MENLELRSLHLLVVVLDNNHERNALWLAGFVCVLSDVSRFDGAYEHVFETVTAGVMLQSPQLDINTVAAGGGSRLFFRNGLFAVG